MTSIDWSALKKTADDATRPLPDGDYTVGVQSAEATTASTGSQMIKLKMRVIGGPSDGRMVFHNIVLSTGSPFALGMFFRALEAFGIDEAWLAANSPSMEQIAGELTGKVVVATLATRAWQGQDRNEVKNLAPADPSIAGIGSSIQSPLSSPSQMSTPSPMAAQGLPPNPLTGGGVSMTPPPGLPV